MIFDLFSFDENMGEAHKLGAAIIYPEPDALADRVRRLLPSHRDPEAFHVERDAIERALRRMARGLPSH